MKSLKYILLFLFFASVTAYAQKYNFKTSGFMVSQKDKKGNYNEDKKFDTFDIEKPINDDNIHLCKGCFGNWSNGKK